MDNHRDTHRNCCNHERRERKGSFLGTVLIVLGILWILKEIGWLHGWPVWYSVQNSFLNLGNIFHFGAIGVTWPVILLIVGVLLLAGRRIIGTLLIFLAILFFLPGGLIIPGILTIFFLPVILIILGIIIIARLLR